MPAYCRWASSRSARPVAGAPAAGPPPRAPGRARPRVPGHLGAMPQVRATLANAYGRGGSMHIRIVEHQSMPGQIRDSMQVVHQNGMHIGARRIFRYGGSACKYVYLSVAWQYRPPPEPEATPDGSKAQH